VVLPVTEIGYEVFANLDRQILPFVGVEKLPVPNGIEGNQADGEQHALFLRALPLASFSDFRLHPFAVHAVRRQDQEQPLIPSYRFVDLLMNLLSGLYIVRREPAADAIVLQIGMQAGGEFLIFGGIADEAGIELKGLPGEVPQVLNKVVGNTSPAQECQRNISMGAVNGVPDTNALVTQE